MLARVARLFEAWERREMTARKSGAVAARVYDAANLDRLARDLKYAEVDLAPSVLDAVRFAHRCGMLNLNPDTLAAALVVAFRQVRSTAAENRLTLAMELADLDWTRFTVPAVKVSGKAERRDKTERRTRLAALVYWLGRVQPKAMCVVVPCERIGIWLGVGRHAAGRLLGELHDAKVINLNPNYSFKKKEARECRYVGSEPGSPAPVGTEADTPTTMTYTLSNGGIYIGPNLKAFADRCHGSDADVHRVGRLGGGDLGAGSG